MASPTHALVVESLELVPRLARKLQLSPKSSVWDDAIQAGRVALIEAAARFDAASGVPFRGYARKFVLGAIKETLSAEHMVRPSRYEGAPVVELDAAYASPRVPAALVDRDVEETQAEALDLERRKANLRAAVRELPPEQSAAIEAVCSGAAMAQYARDEGLPVETARDRIYAAKEKLRALSADSAANCGPPLR